MTRGPKPRSIEVQEASGAFKKDPQRRPTHQVIADSAEPTLPSFIAADQECTDVWFDVIEVLREAKILSRTDTHLVSQYVVTYVQWRRLASWLTEHGHEDPNGKTSPQSVAFFKVSTHLFKLLPELGLSPSSRARLSGEGLGKKIDDEESVSLASLATSMKKRA